MNQLSIQTCRHLINITKKQEPKANKNNGDENEGKKDKDNFFKKNI